MVGKAPSFKHFRPASESSSLSKRRNRSLDTIHELLLRKELWKQGLRYRKNMEGLPGRPDIVFLGPRVAVFCDGDFWHGRNWEDLKLKLAKRANPEYWLAKIASNIERDKRTDLLLNKTGWHVVRLWETTIKQDPKAAASVVRGIVESILRRKRSVLVEPKADNYEIH
ncbi:MAG: very short patch repair endonuclease [Proteobacteria bacterium]|nr:very short patch repair endonuclease [Pseudomonadota bacterium]